MSERWLAIKTYVFLGSIKFLFFILAGIKNNQDSIFAQGIEIILCAMCGELSLEKSRKTKKYSMKLTSSITPKIIAA